MRLIILQNEKSVNLKKVGAEAVFEELKDLWTCELPSCNVISVIIMIAWLL